MKNMKNKIIIGILLSLSAAGAYAQVDNVVQPGIYKGVNGTITITGPTNGTFSMVDKATGKLCSGGEVSFTYDKSSKTIKFSSSLTQANFSAEGNYVLNPDGNSITLQRSDKLSYLFKGKGDCDKIIGDATGTYLFSSR